MPPIKQKIQTNIMQLRYVNLYVGYALNKKPPYYELFNDRERIRFNDGANFISNYLSKAIRKYHFQTDNTFKFIGVHPTLSKETYLERPYDAAVMAYARITNEEYENYLSDSNLINRYEFYLNILERGYAIVSQHKSIPVDSLLECHNMFRKEGYKNEWIFKKFCIPNYSIKVELRCLFSTFDFKLEINAYDKKTSELIANGLIMRTAPNELCYDYKFKSVKIIENNIVIYNFLGHRSFVIDIPKLLNGEVEVEYSEYGKDDDAKSIEELIW